MDKTLKEELKRIKELREKLRKEGYSLPTSWKKVKKAIIYNWKQQNYFK